MTTVPFGSWMAEQTANCEAPPPDGSTATRMLLVLAWYSKSEWRLMSPMRGRLKKASTRCEGKALCVPSEARPMLSRSNIAGSSARMPLTISCKRNAGERWEEELRGCGTRKRAHHLV